MYVDTIIEGPSNFTYFPDHTPLPIELSCNVTGLVVWQVDLSYYTLSNLQDGELPGHNRTDPPVTNILINNPINNTEYICLSVTESVIRSMPAYIYFAGELTTTVYPCVINCVATYLWQPLNVMVDL